MLVTAVVFVVCTLTSNLPDSAVKAQMSRVTTMVTRPWLEQDWRFFAPVPPTASGKVWLTVLVAENGSAIELAPFEIQFAIEDEVKARRWLPPRTPGTTRAVHGHLAHYANAVARIERLPERERASRHAALDARYQAVLGSLARIASRHAQDRFPDRAIAATRVRLTRTEIAPFSRRDVVGVESQPDSVILETSWLPFQRNVGR